MRVILFFLYVALVLFAGYLDHYDFTKMLMLLFLAISAVFILFYRRQEFREKLPINKILTIALLALITSIFVVSLTYNVNYSKYYTTFYKISFIEILLVCIVVPTLEEIVYRLFWLKYLNNRFSNTKSILITSLGFSLLHYYTGMGLIYPFIYGILLSWLYLKFRNIYACIILHVLYNSITILIYTAIYDVEITNLHRGIGIFVTGIVLFLLIRQLYVSPNTISE